MNYSQYSVEDFANDPLFVQWVKAPDPKLDLFWQNWLEQHPDKLPAVEQARNIVLFLSYTAVQPSAQELKEVRANIKKQIISQGGSIDSWPGKTGKIYRVNSLKEKIRRVRSFSSLQLVLVAVLVGVAFALLFQLNTPTVEYATQYGQVKKVVLPDGSTVVINANSSIRLANNWQQTHRREVWLTGEAYFDVLKKPEWRQKSFVVHAEKLDVEVLGTSFNVHNRRGAVQVMLQSGKVRLYPEAKRFAAMDMNPRDLVEVDASTQAVRRKVVEPEQYIAWVQEKLIFDDTPVSEITQLLEDTYGVKVVFLDPALPQARFTGALPNKRLDLFLTVLEESLGLSISRSGQTLFIRSK